MRALGALLLLLVASAACALPIRTLAPAPTDSAAASEEACDAALLEGSLVTDDARGFLVAHESGAVTAVSWPEGYQVEVLDGVHVLLEPSGKVVAREGDAVSLGGGMNADDTTFVVCGPFTVTPAG